MRKIRCLPKSNQFNELPVRSAGNLIFRGILDGMILEGCNISLHESDLAPHSMPHPPHRHRHEEMVFVVEGTLEFTVNGKPTRAGEGSVMFVGSNDEHGILNPESTHAKYFVLGSARRTNSRTAQLKPQRKLIKRASEQKG